MSTPSTPSPDVRIGNDDRDLAIKALDEHLSAGRLDPDEYADRVTKVSVARVFAELEPLFTDLPDPRPSLPSAGAGVSLAKPGAGAVAKREGRAEPLGGRFGETLVALSPFIALALFFLLPVHSWLAFLLIPAAGVIVYGDAHGRKRRR